MSWLTPQEIYEFVHQVGFEQRRRSSGLGGGLSFRDLSGRPASRQEPDEAAGAAKTVAAILQELNLALANARGRVPDAAWQEASWRLATLVQRTTADSPEMIRARVRVEADEILDLLAV